ncbi:MAG: AAA family ATPase, partial [Bdellovibrionales bacterium]
ARQCGKSTLVRQFCLQNNIPLAEINLEETKLRSLEKKDLKISEVINELNYILNLDLTQSQAILFLDEIQAQPRAIEALRYFFEKYPDLPVIAAGSLLEMMLTENPISMPVGRVEYLFLYPLSFGEFIKEVAPAQLYNEWNKKKLEKLPERIHEDLIELLKVYFWVGGMPEAVKEYSKSKSLDKVERIKKNILRTYFDDFLKYASKTQVDKLHKIFSYVPGHLGQKVVYSTVDSLSQSRDLRKAIELLIYSKVIIPVYHSNGSSLPLAGTKDSKIFKLFFLDIGLVMSMMNVQFLDWMNQSLLTSLEGALAEQFVAQHFLLCSEALPAPELFYWLRDKSIQKAELDFIIQKNKKIIPIEVKSN